MMIFADPAKRSRLTPLLHLYWRITRGMTLGVRACVVDQEDCILLIRHSYTPGWHFPGGGVEVGQTLMDALVTELREEANVVMDGAPRLVGMYHNALTAPRDHVALYLVEAWHQPAPPVPNREIVEHGFFARTALPEGTTRGTRERIEELFEARPASPIW
ncbi:NUDIX domain-containing protein [Phreatobacter aquaticus]|uniref:NUDIX domain-containing protein n=1 Tax=Phreatobacter aquaticus TaxID=2570229 RepID=A0A4D7QM69_9HYPH|nr:NUDIX domain-containing protein [Phreatobacter aquaticus]QCK88335.1 NUDIX domain-containing protein [Phreatobacter aquaticus]